MTGLQDQRQNSSGANLSGELRSFIGSYKKRSRVNHAGNIILVSMGLGLGAATVIAGIFDKGRLAACLAALLTPVIGLDRAFGFDDSYRFQELLVVEGEILLTEFEDARGDAEVRRIRGQFDTLKRNAVMSRHGQRMAAVTSLYRDAAPHHLLAGPSSYQSPPAEPGPKKAKTRRPPKRPGRPAGEE